MGEREGVGWIDGNQHSCIFQILDGTSNLCNPLEWSVLKASIWSFQHNNPPSSGHRTNVEILSPANHIFHLRILELVNNHRWVPDMNLN